MQPLVGEPALAAPIIPMADLRSNRIFWTIYNWPNDGHEWSEPWGGTARLFNVTIFPRIERFLPTNTILEIGCGHGRCSAKLIGKCNKFIGVDIIPACIEFCARNYGSSQFILADGKTLPVDSKSVDFVFSWDSLVHCDREVVGSYLKEIQRVLIRNGAGFIHHSNLNHRKADDAHWRASDMSSEIFIGLCAEAGLSVAGQEIISWRGVPNLDCLTLVRNSDGVPKRGGLYTNQNWQAEVAVQSPPQR